MPGMGRRMTWQVKGLADVWFLLGLGETALPPEPPACIPKHSNSGDACDALSANRYTQQGVKSRIFVAGSLTCAGSR